MDELFKYLLQASGSIVLFYTIFHFFLKKDTYFALNRLYLIGSILLALIFPLIGFELNVSPGNDKYVVWLDTITITGEEVRNTVSGNLSFFQVIGVIYFTGLILFSARFIFQFFQLFNLIRRYGVDKENGVNFVFVEKSFSPFSFFNLIFITPNDFRSRHIHEILAHEQVHMRQRHSYDLIILEILTAVLWFNPVIWLYRKSLKEVHEYLADEGVVSSGISNSKYQQILLHVNSGVQLNDLTHNFSKSLLKRRIVMMTKNKSKRTARLKAALAFPVMLTIAMLFSLSMNNYVYSQEDTKNLPDPPDPPNTEAKSQKPPTPPAQVNKADQPIAQNEENVYKVVEEMPSYKGGYDALVKYLVENITYPDDAKQQGKSGTVFVQFIVSATGKISKVSLLRGVFPSLDEEAVRVVSEMPDWNPGKDENGKFVNVEYNLPISFKLDENAKKGEKDK